jgi:predicted MFS family arabinose efflux permease
VAGLALGTVPLSGTKAIMLAWPRERRGMPTGIRQMGVPLGALVAALALPTLATHVGVKPIYAGFAVIVVCCGLIFCVALPSQTFRPTRQQTRLAPGEARRILIPGICGFLLAWGQYSLLTYTIPMLKQDGLSVAIGGALIALAQVGGAAARFSLGAVSDRLFGGRREHVLLGSAVVGVACAIVLAMLPHQLPLAALALLWLIFGGAFVGWNALALTWAGERIAEARAGSAIGLETSAVLSGASVATPLFGAIVEGAGSYQVAWFTLAAILSVAAFLLWTQARKPEPAFGEPHSSDISAESQVI